MEETTEISREKIETLANKDFIERIKQKLDSEFEAIKNKPQLKYTSGIYAGYLQLQGAGCHGNDEFIFFLDTEDKNCKTKVTPNNTISSFTDSRKSLYLTICALPASYFRRTKYNDYAVIVFQQLHLMAPAYYAATSIVKIHHQFIKVFIINTKKRLNLKKLFFLMNQLCK